MPRHLEVRELVDDPGRHGGHEDRGGLPENGESGGSGQSGGKRGRNRPDGGPDGSLNGDHEGQDPDRAGERPQSAPPPALAPPATAVQRVQTGVRMEKRLVKVLKALAELYDRSLGDLLEGIVLHAFEGRSPFSADSLRRIAELQRIYGLDLAARGGQRPLEPSEPRS